MKLKRKLAMDLADHQTIQEYGWKAVLNPENMSSPGHTTTVNDIVSRSLGKQNKGLSEASHTLQLPTKNGSRSHKLDKTLLGRCGGQ